MEMVETRCPGGGKRGREEVKRLATANASKQRSSHCIFMTKKPLLFEEDEEAVMPKVFFERE